MTDPTKMGVAQAATAIAAGALSAQDLVGAHLDRIAANDGALNAFIDVFGAAARADADAADRARAAGRVLGPLHGVPVALKDVFDVADKATSCHSGAGPPRLAQADAQTVVQLREAGAILIGKTAMHEFATGGPSFDLPWPPARNPWDPSRHPGGSSSGSGAAVAARMAPAALGTDTAGSVRHPATACGVTGLKPTYDAISRRGVFPLSETLDHVGPIARSVRDLAVLYDVLRNASTPFNLRAALDRPLLDGCRIGVIQAFAQDADDEVATGFSSALNRLEAAGAQLVPITVPPLEAMTGCGRLILQAEAYALHKSWIDAAPQDYGRRGRQRILAGRSIDAASYINAQRLRRRFADEMEQALCSVQAALCPSSLAQPCRIDDQDAIANTYDRQARTPFNLTGHPAVALPIGLDPNGLPLGVQLVGPLWSETRLLALAGSIEAALGPMPSPPEPQETGSPAHANVAP